MNKHILTFLSLLLCFIASIERPVFSADFDKGFAAYKSGDYAAALREFKPLAQQGNAGPHYFLGDMYNEGHGLPQNFVYAHMWYNIAASSELILVNLH